MTDFLQRALLMYWHEQRRRTRLHSRLRLQIGQVSSYSRRDGPLSWRELGVVRFQDAEGSGRLRSRWRGYTARSQQLLRIH